MRNKLILSMFMLLYMPVKIFADPAEEGKAIFMNRCAACHNVNKTLTGPALAGIDQRRSMDWITRFVQSSQTLVKSGDKDAVAIFQSFNKIQMPDHPDLTEENIKSIVDYIKSATVTQEKAPFAKPSELKPLYKPLSIKDNYVVFLVYLFAVVMLIMTLMFVVRLKSYSTKPE